MLQDINAKLTKGIAAGQDTAQLLLIALQGLDLLQGTDYLYNHAKGYYSTVYADVLHNKDVMQIEYNEALQRLDALEQVTPTSNEDKERIRIAINEHKKIIAEYKEHLAVEV